MAGVQILCQRNENVFQAFARAVKTGALPANAKLFPLPVGVERPEAPAGHVTVASVLIRPREAFAVGVPVGTQATQPTAAGDGAGVKPRAHGAISPSVASYELPAAE